MALERFRYRRVVEAVAVRFYVKFEEETSLKDEASLEHWNELKWLCRKECNGFHPSGMLAGPYHFFYRSHGDLLFVGFLASMCALIVILASGAEAGILVPIKNDRLRFIGFVLGSMAMIVPGAAILLGNRCRDWAIDRAKMCDSQILQILARSARNVELDPPLPTSGRNVVKPASKPDGGRWESFFKSFLKRNPRH